MRDRSFPIVALKYNFAEKSSSSSIEYHDSENEELSADRYVCPYQHEAVKRSIFLLWRLIHLNQLRYRSEEIKGGIKGLS